MNASVSQGYKRSETIVNEFKSPNSLLVYNLGKALSIQIKDITHLEGVGNYTFVCTKHGKYLLSKCLKTVQGRLNNNFVRIHKSYVVNQQHIKSMWVDNIQLDCGKRIPIARRRIRETHEILSEVSAM